MTVIYKRISIDVDELVDELDQDQAHALIEAIDLSQVDAGFTEEVIHNLIKSMIKEFDGWPEELEEFKQSVNKLFEQEQTK